jgi:hypothetical protein
MTKSWVEVRRWGNCGETKRKGIGNIIGREKEADRIEKENKKY